MRKVLGVVAAFAIASVAGVANAADAQNANSNQPAEISATDMDNVTAGVGTGGTFTRSAGVLKIGSFSYVYDGSRWTRVR